MRNLLYCIIAALIFIGCSDEFGDKDYQHSELVVEGWIEAGGFPVVLLTRSLPVSAEYQNMDELSDYMLRWAKVTVICGMDSVVLTGKYDKGYFPPYVYTSSRMKGEAGKQYTLDVEYRDYHATATTTIPSVPIGCSFRVKKCEDSDTLYQIYALFEDDASQKNYYQLFSRVGTASKQYLASYLGSIDDAVLSGSVEMPIYRGHQLKDNDYTPYYNVHDTVSVKFASIDETSYRIWDNYTKSLSLSGNMFLSTSLDMYSNISGGYGYWCGYGAVTRHIVIQDSIQ